MLAEMGIVLLLFTVGLEFSLTEIRRIWRKVAHRRHAPDRARRRASSSCSSWRSSARCRSWRLGLFVGLFVALSSTAIVLQELGTLQSARFAARTAGRRRHALPGPLHRRPAAARADPVGADAAVGRAWSAARRLRPRSASSPSSAGSCCRFSSGWSARSGRREAFPARRAAGEHRHGVGQLAARHLDGARRVPRRPGSRRERVQPPGVRRDPAAARHPRRPVLHLARHAGRSSACSLQAVPDRHRHRTAARDRQGVGCDRRVVAAATPMRVAATAGIGSGAGRRVLVHPRAHRASKSACSASTQWQLLLAASIATMVVTPALLAVAPRAGSWLATKTRIGAAEEDASRRRAHVAITSSSSGSAWAGSCSARALRQLVDAVRRSSI